MVPRSELTRRAKHIIAKYEGTRLGRQELMGDILDSSEGAPWTRDMLEAARDGARSEYVRIVVAVDPAVSANVSSALTGIVVAARGHDGRGYVLADLTGRFSPVAGLESPSMRLSNTRPIVSSQRATRAAI